MKLYRYEKWCCDETLLDWNNNSNVKLRLEEYNVIRETPKRYVIRASGIKEKFVSKDSKSRFAYPTKEEALNNFIRRTQKSIRIMQHHIEFSKIAIKEANQINDNLKIER